MRSVHVTVRIPDDETTGLSDWRWADDIKLAEVAFRGFRTRGCRVFLYRDIQVPEDWTDEQIMAQLDWAVWIDGATTLGQPYWTYGAAKL